MAGDPSPHAVLRTAGEGASLRVMDVEPELARLWQQASEGPDEGHQITRTVLLNLVALCASDETAARSARWIAAVSGDHPSRTIIVKSVPGLATGDISATVSIACQMVTRSEKQVCCEQILLEAGDEDLTGAAGAVLSLTLPDMPLVLWLADGLVPGSESLDRLIYASDRLLVNTAHARDTASALEWVTEQLRASSAVIVDLAWVLLGRCRQAIAQQFDPQRWRLALPKIDHVEVFYDDGSGSDPAPDALLTAGWIVSTLRWSGISLVSAHDGIYCFSADGGKRLELRAEPGHGCGRIRRTMMAAGGDLRFRVFFAESHTEAGLWVEAHGEEVEQTTVRFADLTPEQALCGALEIASRDPVYARAAESAALLARDL